METIAVVVEGDTDLPIVRKLVRDAGFRIWPEIDCGGKGDIDKHLKGYNNAAKGSPWLVVRDLDHDAPCAGEFLKDRGFAPSRWMCFRIAVREIEAWLLADAEGMARFLGVSESIIPKNPESEADPTISLVNLARKSKRRALRKALVPVVGSHTPVGPLYEAKIIEFGEKTWDLDRAASRSASLRRARECLQSLSVRWSRQIRGVGNDLWSPAFLP